jgi:hypothetical protein
MMDMDAIKDRKPLLVVLLVAAAAALGAFLLVSGGDEDASTDTAASGSPQGQGSEAGRPPGGGGSAGERSSKQDAAGDGGDGTRNGSSGGGGFEEETPASLETDPDAIRGAIVTDTGAVQTLEPDDVSREEAMDNSYSSIKAFGEEVEGQEATDITFALLQYLTAKASGDWATACARLYSVLRDNLADAAAKSEDPAVREAGCAAAYGELMKNSSRSAAAEAAEVDVASIRRGEDDRAFVIYKTPDTLSADMPMYLDGGVWTVGALQAYVLTPEQVG